jgi:flavin-dependent dehydrogenase
MELFFFRGGYGGLSLVEEDVANLCFVVRKAELRNAGGWAKLVAAMLDENPHLQSCLQDAKPLWDKPLAISFIPYGYLARPSDGPWRVGDQAAVIPSFTGDGMAIALHSAARAVEMYFNRETAPRYHQRLRDQLRPGMSLAVFLSRTLTAGPGYRLAPLILSLFPHAVRWIATATRIPEKDLLALRTS